MSRNAQKIHARLIAIEVTPSYATDFRRLVREHRERLGAAMRYADPPWIRETRDAAYELLDLWDVPAVASN